MHLTSSVVANCTLAHYLKSCTTKSKNCDSASNQPTHRKSLLIFRFFFFCVFSDIFNGLRINARKYIRTSLQHKVYMIILKRIINKTMDITKTRNPLVLGTRKTIFGLSGIICKTETFPFLCPW